MSLQRGCEIVEYARNKWYLFIAQDEYDYNFNTFELAGHFSTEEGVERELQNHSNPGGVYVTKKPKNSKLTDYLSKWQIKAVKKLKKSGRKRMFFGTKEANKLKR